MTALTNRRDTLSDGLWHSEANLALINYFSVNSQVLQQVMQGFEKLPNFSRALRASEVARAANWNPFVSPYDDLHFVEGMLFSMALVLPFWALVGYAIATLA